VDHVGGERDPRRPADEEDADQLLRLRAGRRDGALQA
jgi:hypothetical protein